MLNTVRARRTVALAATAAATGGVIIGLGASPASADRYMTAASGNTLVQMNTQTFRALTENDCGGLLVQASQGAMLTINKGGKFQVTFPVTSVTYTDTGHGSINHAGAIELSNNCYDVKLKNLKITDIGQGDEQESLDVTARRRVDGEASREVEFTLDTSQARTTPKFKGNSASFKTRSLNLLLSDLGAYDFNQLVNGSSDMPCDSEECQPTTLEASDEPMDGPFHAGDQIGKARSVVRVTYGEDTGGGTGGDL